MNISFNDKTEVFEYPSFESVDLHFKTDTKRKESEAQDDGDVEASSSKPQSSIFKTNNSSVASSGKNCADMSGVMKTSKIMTG